jgi:NAD(P)-dependent dehydrogenase (short-subunit alcohol dehydrogenase family)
VSKGAVLISGAAGGIGTATVDRFLASGYEVAGVDISPSVEGLRREHYRGGIADVTRPGELAAMVEELLKGLVLRHVVSLAGRIIPAERDILKEDPAVAAEAFGSSLALNLSSQFTLIHATVGRLERADGNRSITLCSSVNAMRGYGAPAYSAAKAGLVGMMHALATPLGRQGIRINVVAPGTTRTPLLVGDLSQGGDPEKIMARIGEEIPLGRVGEPDDVAAVIESLADRLTHVTDDVLRVDGGQVLASPLRQAAGGRLDRWRAGVRRRLQIRPNR